MSEAGAVFPNIDQNVATNVREFRERSGLSQEELAQRMSERGFGFSQATVWKIESGQRTVKISEAVALSDVLDLRWMDLTAEPDVSRHQAALAAANRRAHQAYAALKETATAFLRTQVELSLTVRLAQDYGLTVTEPHRSWLDFPAERAVIEARVEYDQEEEAGMQQADTVNAILAALREHGYEPPRPEDWLADGGEPTASRVDDVTQAELTEPTG